MKNHTKLEEWHYIIAHKEQTFISPIMEKAAKFLQNARNERSGWGYYKGLPTDIHASSLAIEALRIFYKEREISAEDTTEHKISAEDATEHIKKTFMRDNLDTFGVQELVDLLNIVSGTELRDSELELKVMARLKDLRHGVGWGDPEPSISLSCGVILAFMKLENPPQEVIKQWVDYLAQYQRPDDGGWGATRDSKSAIIPTSQALRVLNRFSDKSLGVNRSASIEFLRNYFQTKGWNELGDTFTISTVLRTLGELENFPFEVVQAGIDSLYERVDSEDGGWGAIKGEQSNIEQTALSMIALSSAGENKFVPSRLVSVALETIETEIKQLRNERDRLSEDIDQRVKEKAGNIIQQRNELQKEVDFYKEKAFDLEAKVEKTQYEFNKAKRDTFMNKFKNEPRFLLMHYRTSVLAVLLTATVSICAYIFLGGSTTLFLTTIISFVIGLSTFFFLLWRRQLKFSRRYELGFGAERSFVVHELSDLLAEWPPSKREDLLFQLMRVVEKEVPPDALVDISMHLSRKYVERESQHRRLQEIMYRLMSLPPSARLDVIDKVRDRMVRSYEKW
jgi:hypothetical protein